MFEIRLEPNGEIRLQGRFDATQVEKAFEIFNQISKTTTIDFSDLDYISSAGLSVLLKTQKRLKSEGHELIIKNLNRHIREIFKYAGFDLIFKIE